MAEGISKTILKYDLDEQSSNRAKQGIASIGDVTDSLTAKQNRLQIEAEQSAKELIDLRTKMRGLDGKEFEQAALRAARLEEKLASINDQITDMGRVRTLADDFDEISRNVSAGGDLQSNLGAIRGLSGAAGLSGISGGLDILGEASALVEELPRLASSMAGVKDAAKSAVSVLGAGGIGLIGGIAALALVVGESAKTFEAGKQAALETLDVESRLVFLRTQGSKEDIEAAEAAARLRKQEALAAIEAADSTIAAIKGRVSEDEFSRIKLRAGLGVSSDPNAQALAAANEILNEMEPVADAATRELIALQGVMADVGVQARVAADAQDDLTEQQEANADRAIRRQIELQGRAGQFTSESLDKEIQSLENRKAILEKVIDAGVGSNALLSQFSQELRDINGDLSTLRLTIAPLVQDTEKLTQAEADRKRQIEATAKVMEGLGNDVESITANAEKRRVDLIRKAEDDIIKAAEKAAADAERVLRQLEQKRDQIGLEFGRGERDAGREAQFEALNDQIAFQNEEAKSRRAHLLNLERIQQSFDDREEDLIANRDFAGIRRNRRDALNALRDQNTSFSAEQKERLTAAKERASDAKRQRIFEAEQRQVRFDDRVADLEAQATRDLALIDDQQQKTEAKLRASRDEQLKIVGDTAREETRIKFEAAKQQLEIANFTKNQMIAFERDRQEALLAQARQFQAGFFGGGNTTNYNSFSQANQFQSGGGAAQQQALAGQIATAAAALVLRQLKAG